MFPFSFEWIWGYEPHWSSTGGSGNALSIMGLGVTLLHHQGAYEYRQRARAVTHEHAPLIPPKTDC